MKELDFLGHNLSDGQLKPSTSKIKVTADWQEPKNLDELRVFLGFSNYYRKFVPKFSAIAQPLNALTKKGVEFDFNEKCKQAFRTLRAALMSELVLI